MLVILDYLGSSLSEDILKLKNTVLLIPPDCVLPPSAQSIFQVLQNADAFVQPGNYLVRTSDDCLRGIILGKLAIRNHHVLIYSSRPETISKYIQTCQVEPWPNDLSSYYNFAKTTLEGPKAGSCSMSDTSPSKPPTNLQISDVNAPAPLQRSEKPVYVEPLRPSNSPNIPKSEPIIKNKQENPLVIEQNEGNIIGTYFGRVFDMVTEHEDFTKISNFGDLYSLVHRVVRSIAEKNQDIQENDHGRLGLIDQACLRILEYGFFNIIGGYGPDELVELKGRSKDIVLKYAD